MWNPSTARLCPQPCYAQYKIILNHAKNCSKKEHIPILQCICKLQEWLLSWNETFISKYLLLFLQFQSAFSPQCLGACKEVLDCRDWVWRCFIVNYLGFDQFWLFCFCRSWSTREEPLWMKSKLPKTLGLAKLWTLSKRRQAHSHCSSLSRPCHPKRAVHSSWQTPIKSTKNNTTEPWRILPVVSPLGERTKGRSAGLKWNSSVFFIHSDVTLFKGGKNNSWFMLNSYFPNCLAESHVLIPSYFYTLFYMTRC